MSSGFGLSFHSLRQCRRPFSPRNNEVRIDYSAATYCDAQSNYAHSSSAYAVAEMQVSVRFGFLIEPKHRNKTRKFLRQLDPDKNVGWMDVRCAAAGLGSVAVSFLEADAETIFGIDELYPIEGVQWRLSANRRVFRRFTRLV